MYHLDFAGGTQLQSSTSTHVVNRTRCSQCGMVGHNKRKCKNGPIPLSSEVGSSSVNLRTIVPKRRKTSQTRIVANNQQIEDRSDVDLDQSFVDNSEDEKEAPEVIVERDFIAEYVENVNDPVPDELEQVLTWQVIPTEDIPKTNLRQRVDPIPICQLYPKYKGRQAGPKLDGINLTCPTDYFELLWDIDIMNQFMTSSNAYATGKLGERDWNPIDMAEMKTFFAIIMYLGMNRSSSREYAWENELFGSRFCMDDMSKTRFERI